MRSLGRRIETKFQPLGEPAVNPSSRLNKHLFKRLLFSNANKGKEIGFRGTDLV